MVINYENGARTNGFLRNLFIDEEGKNKTITLRNDVFLTLSINMQPVAYFPNSQSLIDGGEFPSDF